MIAPQRAATAAPTPSGPCGRPATEVPGVTSDPATRRTAPPVLLTRTSRGWSVSLRRPAPRHAADLVEGLSLADLVAEELGAAASSPTAPPGARPGAPSGPAGGTTRDPVDARVAELERTVAQLEHALAARVVHRARHRRPGRAARDQRPFRVRVAARGRPLAGPAGRRARPRGARRARPTDPGRTSRLRPAAPSVTPARSPPSHRSLRASTPARRSVGAADGRS